MRSRLEEMKRDRQQERLQQAQGYGQLTQMASQDFLKVISIFIWIIVWDHYIYRNYLLNELFTVYVRIWLRIFMVRVFAMLLLRDRR